MDRKMEIIKDMRKAAKENKCILCGQEADAIIGAQVKKKGKKTNRALAFCDSCLDGITESLIKRMIYQAIEKGKLEDFVEGMEIAEDCGDEGCPIHGKKGVKRGRERDSDEGVAYN